MLSCTISKNANNENNNKSESVESQILQNKDIEIPIKIGNCGETYISRFKNLIISDLDTFDGGGWLNCIYSYGLRGDTAALKVLFELSNSISNNVHKFNHRNSSDIDMFLQKTLYITPKSNKWIPVLMNFAKDVNCEHNSSGHWPSGEHFGMWVTGAIISNLTDREYAEELSDFKSNILKNEFLSSGNRKFDCKWKKKRHKIFMERLEKDYRDGKLNFE